MRLFKIPPRRRWELPYSGLFLTDVSVPIVCPETAIKNYHYSLPYSPVERNSQIIAILKNVDYDRNKERMGILLSRSVVCHATVIRMWLLSGINFVVLSTWHEEAIPAYYGRQYFTMARADRGRDERLCMKGLYLRTDRRKTGMTQNRFSICTES